MATVREDSPFVSHGRGGAANVSRDDQPYADAGIVREGNANAPGSTGRGGQGNISTPATPSVGSPLVKATVPGSGPSSSDVVPELSVKQAPGNYHIGRGGEGNAHVERTRGGSSSDAAEAGGDMHQPAHVHEGAAQRFKEMLLGKEGKP